MVVVLVRCCVKSSYWGRGDDGFDRCVWVDRGVVPGKVGEDEGGFIWVGGSGISGSLVERYGNRGYEG